MRSTLSVWKKLSIGALSRQFPFRLIDGVIRVHALTKSAADELAAGEMDRRVDALRDG